MVNPAVLPEGWTQASLLESHHSHPFNPDIANAFFRAGEIEAWGRGIERIFDACREAGTPRPALRFQANGLWIEFPFAKEYLDVIHGAGASRVSGRITDPVADPVADPVVELLRILADGPLPPSAIQKTLGLKHRPTFRANYLYRAMERGLIEMTIPETPSSRLQKYRLTVEGHKLLDSLDQSAARP